MLPIFPSPFLFWCADSATNDKNKVEALALDALLADEQPPAAVSSPGDVLSPSPPLAFVFAGSSNLNFCFLRSLPPSSFFWCALLARPMTRTKWKPRWMPYWPTNSPPQQWHHQGMFCRRPLPCRRRRRRRLPYRGRLRLRQRVHQQHHRNSLRNPSRNYRISTCGCNAKRLLLGLNLVGY